ncbi:cytochrome c oxidase accessory protein CcoG [Hyphobacterium marinum]|uniref:Cytochrome c oxidase accessory protein CcoG n=1 Tax=Hyphobacterium marinum TaxID=3116574 RepID=A0ABU7LU60_9PROT|nr:cytochrome c oxidase accessory protein CcoG [Hyphobacterium sp. Y6023]MEE2565074.1 cytochrome c oxidase accessory protein CcoG [Hyphobacterium sp. Y6023]
MTAQQQDRMAAPGVRRSKAQAVNDPARRELYKKREPIYPKLVHGKFRAAKWLFMAVALGIYYFIPFLRWPRAGDAPDQAVLVDFAGRRFYFFWIEIWPQEIYFVTGLLIMAALALFLVTALFGRVWCGYACPQTVWTDLFIAVERLFEGDRNKRIMLDRAPWSFNKAWRKVGKHAVWLLIAGATGGAWILYFHDAFDTLSHFFTGGAAISSYIFFATLTFTTYTLAGTMREQVCIYMCPWPRIQAAMTDMEALNVAYRVDRGEPRGPHKKSETWDGRGDCIDCKACVAACPMGIDIRNGSQLECIQCALCIDACDDIMKKVDRPTGLIAYETDENIARRQAGEKPRYRLLRPRVLFYATALALVSAVMLVALTSRSTLDLNVQRDRNPNFVRLADGSVRNGYTLTVINKTHEAQEYRLVVDSDEPVAARLLNGGEGTGITLPVGPDMTRDFRLFLTLPADAIDDHLETFTFRIEAASGESASARAVMQTGAAR